MSTAKAISRLRVKLVLSQEEFGRLVGIAGPTVSRLETGSREPSARTLARLEKLAKEAGTEDLHNLFSAKRKSNVAGQVERLMSPGAARRIPVWELSYLANALEILSRKGDVRVARKAMEVLSPYLCGEK
jgi:transcriptional regulator with XRE-family HTH domain